MRKPVEWALWVATVCLLVLLLVCVRGFIILRSEVREGNAFWLETKTRAARLHVDETTFGQAYGLEYTRLLDSDRALDAAEKDIKAVYVRELQLLHGDESKAITATEVYFSPAHDPAR